MENKQTAVDYLIEQLQAPCRGIPSHIIEEAKRIEQEQRTVPPQDELDQVRQAKDRHVKQQNYMIATLYREIERLLSKHAQTASFAKTGKMTEEEWQEAERQSKKK
jgi:hypothetical protein